MSNKRTSRITTSLFLLMLVSPFSHAEEVLYCVDELATGIALHKGKWGEWSFVKQKRTVKFNDDRSEMVGFDDDEIFACSPLFEVETSPHSWACHDEWGFSHLFINMATMRYEYANMSPFGYQYGVDAKGNTSRIYAGTCTAF